MHYHLVATQRVVTFYLDVGVIYGRRSVRAAIVVKNDFAVKFVQTGSAHSPKTLRASRSESTSLLTSDRSL